MHVIFLQRASNQEALLGLSDFPKVPQPWVLMAPFVILVGRAGVAVPSVADLTGSVHSKGDF